MANHDGLIDPPNSFTVTDRRVVLWTHDERPLVRQAGFCMQTSSGAPQFSDGTRKTVTTRPLKATAKPKPTKKGGKC